MITENCDKQEDYKMKAVFATMFDLRRSGCAYEEAEVKLIFLELFLTVLSKHVPGSWFVILVSDCLS